MWRLICLLIGYAFGLFQTGYIIGRLNGIDIRSVGSKNAGTTNTLRSLGQRQEQLLLSEMHLNVLLLYLYAAWFMPIRLII